MKKFIIGSILLLFAGSESVLAAQGNVDIGCKVGTLGGGVELTFDVLDDLALRGGLDYLKFNFNASLAGVDYTMEPEFKNMTMLLDWYPLSGAFRITGGFSLNDNKVDVNGTASRDLVPSEYAQYGSFTQLLNVQGNVDFNAFAPYVGIGWSSNHGDSGWGVSCDFGILFQGAAAVSDLNIVPAMDYGMFQETVDTFLAEQRKEIQDELDKYEYYPVASIMLNYTF